MARAKKTDQEKSAGKTTRNATKKPEAAEQTQAPAPEPEATEQDTDTTKKPEATEQTKAPAPEPEATEQDTDTATEPETTEQDTDTAPEPETTEQGEGSAPEPDMFANLPNPCVYCGPSVKGIARQYTTYQGGIPDALREFIKARPDALGLIVSTGKFQAMRRRLETIGTKEARLYKAVKEGL